MRFAKPLSLVALLHIGFFILSFSSLAAEPAPRNNCVYLTTHTSLAQMKWLSRMFYKACVGEEVMLFNQVRKDERIFNPETIGTLIAISVVDKNNPEVTLQLPDGKTIKTPAYLLAKSTHDAQNNKNGIKIKMGEHYIDSKSGEVITAQKTFFESISPVGGYYTLVKGNRGVSYVTHADNLQELDPNKIIIEAMTGQKFQVNKEAIQTNREKDPDYFALKDMPSSSQSDVKNIASDLAK